MGLLESMGHSSFRYDSSLQHDDNSDIEEDKHICQLCGYQTAQKNYLKLHEQAVHEGNKYQCNQCEFQATKKSKLVTHQQALHEGMKYQCNRCDYQATWKSDLKTY